MTIAELSLLNKGYKEDNVDDVNSLVLEYKHSIDSNLENTLDTASLEFAQLILDRVSQYYEEGIAVISLTVADMWIHLGHPNDEGNSFTEDDRYKMHQLYVDITTSESIMDHNNRCEFKHEQKLYSVEEVLRFYKYLQIRLAGICPTSILFQNDIFELMFG